jgi:hypothetical protein
MRAEALPVARNMSAPPRTTLTFVALAPPAVSTGEAGADGAGFRFVCRLDARALLPKSHQQSTPGFFWSPEPVAVHKRIRLGLVHVRAEAAGRKRAHSGAYAHACAAPIEAVADELRDVLAAESLSEAGLPPFGMFLPAYGEERAVLGSLTRTLAILARRRGSVFLRNADPIVWSAVSGEAFDLWTPAVSGRTP